MKHIFSAFREFNQDTAATFMLFQLVRNLPKQKDCHREGVCQSEDCEGKLFSKLRIICLNMKEPRVRGFHYIRYITALKDFKAKRPRLMNGCDPSGSTALKSDTIL